jgi:RHS repeat-associated protein
MEAVRLTPPMVPHPILPANHFHRAGSLAGTQRATTDAHGVARARCLGLPFGDVMSCRNRPDPHYFTIKERDAESSDDSFGARHYNSSIVRLISPDHLFVDQHPEDPQSWNLYAYVRNNPLIMLDPNGLGCLFEMESAGNGQWNVGISNSLSLDDCAGQHGTWVPDDINANDVGVYRNSDGNPMFQVTTNTGGNVYNSTFASGAQADEDGTCLNGCQGASIAHAPTDWLSCQIGRGTSTN